MLTSSSTITLQWLLQQPIPAAWAAGSTGQLAVYLIRCSYSKFGILIIKLKVEHFPGNVLKVLWERSICHSTKCRQASQKNISNPDAISLSLKYLLAIKTNPSSLILAYPKWSVLPTAAFTTDATSICGYSGTLTLSLSLSPLSCPLAPSFCFI
jgi:hypothetical protein